MGTDAFADAVIARLGQEPSHFTPVRYNAKAGGVAIAPYKRRERQTKTLVGVDVFVDMPTQNPDELASKLNLAAGGAALSLKMITNRGVKVWPQGLPETFKTDHWRCRFMGEGVRKNADVVDLLTRLEKSGVDFVKTEQLYEFDGKPGYSLGQGQ